MGEIKISTTKKTLEFPKNRTSDSRGIPRLCGFRDFEDSEISRNLKFLAVPVLCHDNVMQPRKGSGARGARARGRVFGCVSARPPMPAMPHDRSGASLGKSKICDFEFLVVRFGPPLPFLALSCVQSSPMSGTLRFSQNLSRIIAFRVPDKRETGPEDAWWSRGPLPMVPAATTTTAQL